jgi:hypothetical protein
MVQETVITRLNSGIPVAVMVHHSYWNPTITDGQYLSD